MINHTHSTQTSSNASYPPEAKAPSKRSPIAHCKWCCSHIQKHCSKTIKTVTHRIFNFLKKGISTLLRILTHLIKMICFCKVFKKAYASCEEVYSVTNLMIKNYDLFAKTYRILDGEIQKVIPLRHVPLFPSPEQLEQERLEDLQKEEAQKKAATQTTSSLERDIDLD